jgi:hypothetical protein
LRQYYQLLSNIKTIIHLTVGINLDILLLLLILSSTFLTFRAWDQEGEGIDGKGKGPGAADRLGRKR